ncbi:MAG: glutamyl-tRNA reductase [Desulfobacterales bacterium]
MLDIVLLGLNHKTAPVALRECLTISKDETSAALRAFQELSSIREVMLFSTCNRVEILMVAEDKSNAVDAVKSFLSELKHLPVSEFEESLYLHEGDDAVRHVFRVAASLDSMVVGEPQILGQIKEAYKMATQSRTSGVLLNKLLHRTFFVAKRIRTETGIGDNAVSISYAAIKLGRKIFGTFEGKKVLLIGAGEMAELAVEHLIRNRAGAIVVANRTFENGVDLAKKFEGQAIRFEEIQNALEQVDIIISSTGSLDYVVTREHVKAIIRRRRNRPLFLDRNKEAIKGERIVDEAVISFRQWYDNLDVTPTIVELRKKIEEIAQGELKRTQHTLKHLSDDDIKAISRMTDAMVNKILHDPTLLLKSNGRHQDKSVYLDVTRKLFKLDE